MIIAPFAFFLICIILYLKKNRGLSIYIYILGLYTLISFFSILIDIYNLYDMSCPKVTFGIISPIIYILLLYICIYPFKYIHDSKIIEISKSIRPRIYNLIVYGYFIIFLIVLFVSLTRINEIFTSNLKDIRNELYVGTAVSFYDHLHGLPRYISAICSILAPSGYIMILFLGYNLACLKRSLVFNIITIAGSMTQLLIGINIADRSTFVYWLLLFGLSVTIFHRFFNNKAKKVILFIGGFLILIMITYIITVTFSRFGERAYGTSGGIIVYAGQSYINFCRFFDTLYHSHLSLNVIFPIISKYLFNSKSYFELCKIIELQTGQFIAVFSTFIGFIMSISGRFAAIIYCLIYNRISLVIIRSKRTQIISLQKIVNIWIIAIVPILGLFGHFYYAETSVIAIIVWLIISKIITKS